MTYSLLLLELGRLGLAFLLLTLALLQESLGDKDVIFGGDRTVRYDVRIAVVRKCFQEEKCSKLSILNWR